MRRPAGYNRPMVAMGLREDVEKEVMEAVLQVRSEKFEEALGVLERHLPSLSSGNQDEKVFAASALSYYGLCLAKVRRRYAEGAKYCRLSLRVHPREADHYANLSRVYLEANNRREAVDALNRGLRYDPENRELNRILDEIGRRRRPVLRFLPRDNFLNVWLGKKRRRSRRAPGEPSG